MATLKQIKARLRELGLENEYGYRAETKLIPKSLEADEELLQMTSGIREGRRWYLVLTPRRLLLLTKPTLGTPGLVAIEREKIKGVTDRRKLFFASLTIETEEGEYVFSNVLKKSLPSFLRELQ